MIATPLRDLVRRLFLAAGMLTIMLILLFPVIYTGLFSFAPITEIFSLEMKMYPRILTLDNYDSAINDAGFLVYFRNSMLVALPTVFLSVSVGAMAGYALACLQMRGRNLISIVLLLVYLLPNILFLIPLYLLIVWLGLADTLFSLILAYTAFCVPLATWSLRAFFAGIPKDLIEAAKLDGCTEFGAFGRIVLPLSTPGLVTAAVFSFVVAWNDLFYALTFIHSDSLQVLTVAISATLGQWSAQVGTLLALSVLSGIPILLAFVVVNRFFISGLTAGSVKG